MDYLFKTEHGSDFEREITDVTINCFDINNSHPAREELKTLILKTQCNLHELEKILADKGFEKERVLYFLNLIDSKKSELLYLSLINYNSKFGEAVSDFDWGVKHVNGTSELKNLKYPLLQLTLTTTKNCVQSQKVFDISKHMLNRLIDVLETIN